MRRLALYPASLDPVHNGHIDIARRAARIFDELIVGVYDQPQKALCFTVEERLHLAQMAFAEDAKIRVAKYSGLTVHFAREVGALAIVRGLRVFSDFELEFRMGLANRLLEPTIETVAVMAGGNFVYLSSSTIREIAALGGDVSGMVPPHVARALRERYVRRA